MVAIPTPFVGSVLSLPDPPIPTRATFSTLFGSLQVTFDKQLHPCTLAPGNWRLRHSDMLYTCISATSSTNKVNAACALSVEDVGPDVVWYDATPPDLLGLDLQPVAPIVAYPLT